MDSRLLGNDGICAGDVIPAKAGIHTALTGQGCLSGSGPPAIGHPGSMHEGTASAPLPLLDAPWCPAEEYRGRLRRVQHEITARGLDGLVLFQPESVTWLTGFPHPRLQLLPVRAGPARG